MINWFLIIRCASSWHYRGL